MATKVPEVQAADDSTTLTKGQRTRARLVAAAEEVFGEGTYDDASVVEITRRAGVSPGTFYLYFPSKIDIFREVVRELGHQVRSTIARAIEDRETRAEKEREGFRAFFDFVSEHPNLYRIIRQAEFVDPASYRAHYERLAKGYVRGLKEAMASGEFRDADPEVLAYSLMGTAELVGARWLLWNGRKARSRMPAEVVEGLIDLILHGTLAEGN